MKTMMFRLQLTNFRSFETKEFCFEKNFILISGDSGCGKTTIFMAIQFVLSGDGKKVTMFGKKNCCVKYISDAITITRTKGPCRLLVKHNGVEYEDKTAQAIIDSEFKNWELGYISQRISKAFILAQPSEKLAFIENIAFGEENIEQILKKCKAMIMDRKTKTAMITKEHETLQQLLKAMNVPEIVEDKSIQDIELEISEIEKKIQKLTKQIESNDQKISRRNQLLEELELIPKIDKEFSQSFEDVVTQYNQYAAYEQVKEMLKTKTHSGESQDEILYKLRCLERIETLNREFAKLQKVLNELQKLEKFKETHAIILSCPSCCSKLGLWGNELKSIDETVQSVTLKEMETIDKKYFELKCILQKEEEVYVELAHTPRFDQTIAELKQIQRSDEEFLKLENKCKKLQCDKPIISLQEYKDAIKNKTLREAKQNELNSIIFKNMDKEIQEKQDLLNKKNQLELEMKNLNTKHHWDRVEVLKIEETEQQSKLSSALKLTSLVKTAEKLAISETIDRLNFFAQIYLDKFVESLSVQLIFEDKISVQVIHNQNESDLSALSGGELARVVVAFTIALAEMNNVNLLLFDESLASLDLDSTNSVMQTIKENFIGTVVVIAHQTTKGVFEQVIEL